ncbi:MAG TPA: LysM peptidoglycan-binding domain-containing protein [Kofleriaceae bacterium]|jgi:LysM repeat protein
MKRFLLIAIVVGLAQPVHAQSDSSGIVTIKATKGDSLQLLAAEYYGDRNKAIYIMVANKMDHPRPLKPGERIRIPTSREYTTAPGDTFETISATFLGDARRGTFLAEFNGMPADDRIASGTELTIPFTVTHTAEATETISAIAAAYFGNDKNASLIRRYNFLDKDEIEKGDHVIVPITNVRLSPNKLPPLDAQSRERRDRQAHAKETAAKAIPAARQAWRDGDFALMRDALAPLEADVDFLETAQAVDVLTLLGAMRVAFNDNKSALEAFKRVLDRKRDTVLSPYLYSKKVLDVWDAARSELSQ